MPSTWQLTYYTSNFLNCQHFFWKFLIFFCILSLFTKKQLSFPFLLDILHIEYGFSTRMRILYNRKDFFAKNILTNYIPCAILFSLKYNIFLPIYNIDFLWRFYASARWIVFWYPGNRQQGWRSEICRFFVIQQHSLYIIVRILIHFFIFF